MRRLYYVYDAASATYMYFCEAPADAVAIRSFKAACETDFRIAAPDLSLYCLGSLEDFTISPLHELVFKYTVSNAMKED